LCPQTERRHRCGEEEPAEGTLASRAWDTLETFARQEIQGFLQRLVEEEVTDLLERGKRG